MFDPPSDQPYTRISPTVIDSSAHRALALTMARESMVLLKNANNLLPLDYKALTSVAVIGYLSVCLCVLVCVHL